MKEETIIIIAEILIPFINDKIKAEQTGQWSFILIVIRINITY